ncbi:hypothetical protein DFH09DRAFT_1358574 [Mycena vulgaris]|nr:hypothetical protein DFH09DRAFT_1358574 [Mycena vulgaris]
MRDTISPILSLCSMVLIPFIPNNIMRYVALVLALLFSAVYLVFHSCPTSQVVRLDAFIKEIDVLFNIAVNECTRDPQFIYEAGLKLVELKYAVSSLRTGIISTKYIPWKKYLHHLVRLASSITECWREMNDLRVAVTLALEFARRQKFEDDIKHRTATIVRNFLEEFLEDARVRDESGGERPIVFERVVFSRYEPALYML